MGILTRGDTGQRSAGDGLVMSSKHGGLLSSTGRNSGSGCPWELFIGRGNIGRRVV
jgi:hypothetical protein